MFPFRHRSIFRSRWIALLWAAGICWSAVSLVPDPAPADGNAAQASPEISAEDAHALRTFLDEDKS